MLIAGVRDNELSRRVAGEEGVALARKFAAVTPEFPSCIRARDRDARRTVARSHARLSQVVVVGVGLDVKPLEFASERQPWFGIDLREGLELRARLLSRAGLTERHFIGVAADLRGGEWQARLLSEGFDPRQPTLFIVEGLSMYLSRAEIRGLFVRLHSLAGHEECMVWVDHFSREFFIIDEPTVRGFIELIAKLGEPFITGFNSFEWLDETGWILSRTTRASELVDDPSPTLHEYLFSVLCRREGPGDPARA